MLKHVRDNNLVQLWDDLLTKFETTVEEDLEDESACLGPLYEYAVDRMTDEEEKKVIGLVNKLINKKNAVPLMKMASNECVR